MVKWNASTVNGSPVTSYTVTSNPGGLTANTPDGATTQATVGGLANGTAYTFTVVANSAAGASQPSTASNSVTPAPASSPGSLPGSVQMAPDGANGLDTNLQISMDSAQQIAAGGNKFVIRYVSLSSTEQGGDLTHDEAVTILNASLALMPVQHVLNAGWQPTGALGTQFGTSAANNAAAVGFPGGVNVWLDLEGVAPSAASQDVIDYCNNWFDVVSAKGFVPGVYVGADNNLTGAQLGALKFQHFWKSPSTVPTVAGRGYQMIQSLPSSGFGLSDLDKDVSKADLKSGLPDWIIK